jgi:hypothetical protein
VGGTDNHDLPEANPRVGYTVTARPRPTLVGYKVTTHLRPSQDRTGSPPEATLGWERQSRLARGQAQAGQAITTSPRPSSGETGSHDSPEANPPTGDTVTTHLRPSPGWTVSHDSPEAILGWDKQSRLVRGQPRVG